MAEIRINIEINKGLLLHRILHSGDFTALEKRYLENLIVRAMEGEPEESSLPQTFRDSLLDKFSKRR
jgi:hypothetical protein